MIEEERKTFHINSANVCLNCGQEVNEATGTSGVVTPPQEGDIALCRYCGHLAAFDRAGLIRELTDKEAHTIAGHPTVVKAVNALRIRRKR